MKEYFDLIENLMKKAPPSFEEFLKMTFGENSDIPSYEEILETIKKSDFYKSSTDNPSSPFLSGQSIGVTDSNNKKVNIAWFSVPGVLKSELDLKYIEETGVLKLNITLAPTTQFIPQFVRTNLSLELKIGTNCKIDKADYINGILYVYFSSKEKKTGQKINIG